MSCERVGDGIIDVTLYRPVYTDLARMLPSSKDGPQTA
jgi:hypothetical protein